MSADGVLVHNACGDEIVKSDSVDFSSKKNSPDQSALIKLAKEVKKKGGADSEDIAILLEWAKEYRISSHGPEIHPNRPGPVSYIWHIHIGPVDHIPIIDME